MHSVNIGRNVIPNHIPIFSTLSKHILHKTNLSDQTAFLKLRTTKILKSQVLNGLTLHLEMVLSKPSIKWRIFVCV